MHIYKSNFMNSCNFLLIINVMEVSCYRSAVGRWPISLSASRNRLVQDRGLQGVILLHPLTRLAPQWRVYLADNVQPVWCARNSAWRAHVLEWVNKFSICMSCWTTVDKRSIGRHKISETLIYNIFGNYLVLLAFNTSF